MKASILLPLAFGIFTKVSATPLGSNLSELPINLKAFIEMFILFPFSICLRWSYNSSLSLDWPSQKRWSEGNFLRQLIPSTSEWAGTTNPHERLWCNLWVHPWSYVGFENSKLNPYYIYRQYELFQPSRRRPRPEWLSCHCGCSSIRQPKHRWARSTISGHHSTCFRRYKFTNMKLLLI